MSAFTLDPKPTFKLTVTIPIPGEPDGTLDLMCKYRNGTERKKFVSEEVFVTKKVKGTEQVVQNMTDVQVLEAIVVDWGIKGVPCTPENLARLENNFPGTALNVLKDYMAELGKAREKN